MNYYVHETAMIDDGAIIGDNTKIWHWSHISSKAIIGNNCTLGQNVFIADNVVIGNNVKIQNNVSIYDGVTLDDDVFCGPSIVFTNVKNPRSDINQKNNFLKTHVKKGSTLGANSTIICGTKIGKYSFVGAGSLVTKNIFDHALFFGVPAVQVGWVSHCGYKLDLPLIGNKTVKCKVSNREYFLNENILESKND